MAKVMEGRKVVMVEMSEELVARADAAAERELLNRSSWLRRLVDAATKREEVAA
jgi:metal-responsive CopG/Arc/MetJ family transcriptional regulator